MEPSTLRRSLPSGVHALPAERDARLHPALRHVVNTQAEFAAWTPSRLCLYYFGRIEASGERLSSGNGGKVPMLALWSVAGEAGEGGRREVALEIFANSSRLESPAKRAGVDLEVARTSVGPVPVEEEGQAGPDERYTVRLGKSRITWDGRPAADSTGLDSTVTEVWQVEGRKGGWLDARLALRPRMTGGMIGSLKVEGKGDLAEMLLRSPTRFVGPGYVGGGGTFYIAR